MRYRFCRIATLCVAVAVGLQAWGQQLAILSDLHVTPGNANEGKLREAVAEINASNVDAVIVSGDLTNEGSDEQLLNVKGILDEIAKPQYVIPGNHENNWSQSACKTFNDLWGNDRFVFTVGKLVVVGMNCGPFMKMGDGHIKQEDLAWLDATLAARVRPGMRVLSINHYPILADLDNYLDYVDVLKKYPVVTHQCGHYHQYRQYETQGINGLIVRALDMKNGDYGYTILDIDLDREWIHVSEKKIGREPEVKYAYRINLEYYNQERPQPKAQVAPGFEVRRIVADEASVFTRLGVDSKNLYYGTSTGVLKAVDKTTGELRWSYPTGAMLFSRPAVSSKVVVLPTADKRLVWLDKKTGRELYSHAAAGPYVADGVIDGNILYQGGYKTFQAWDVKRHKLLWQYDSIDNYCQAAPVVWGNQVVFGAWDTKLRSLDKGTGKLQWSWNNGSSANMLSPGNVVPVVTADKVVIVAPDRVATAIDRASGKQVWREKNQYKVRESLGVSRDGKVAYAKTMDGELLAFDTQGDTYRKLWSVDLGIGYEHAPCIVLEHNGLVYTGSRHGELNVVDASTRQVVLSYSMGSSEVNGFEVDEKGNVYCSLVEGTIYCISQER